MAAYDLYGYLVDDIDGARNILEFALGIQFKAHNGVYQGGDYFRWD